MENPAFRTEENRPDVQLIQNGMKIFRTFLEPGVRGFQFDLDAFPLDGIVDGPDQDVPVHLAFEQIILRPFSNGPDGGFPVIQAREQDLRKRGIALRRVFRNVSNPWLSGRDRSTRARSTRCSFKRSWACRKDSAVRMSKDRP